MFGYISQAAAIVCGSAGMSIDDGCIRFQEKLNPAHTFAMVQNYNYITDSQYTFTSTYFVLFSLKFSLLFLLMVLMVLWKVN